MRAFSQFRGLSSIGDKIIWQERPAEWPYRCSQCQRDMPPGGVNYLGNSMVNLSHKTVAVLCPDCKHGRDPHRQPVPKMAERRTSLD